MTNTSFDIFSIMFTAVVVLGVFVLTYYATRFIAKSYGGGSFLSKNSNIKIIERVALGKQQSLIIAKVANRYILLGVTADNIQKLETLDEDQLVALTSETENETKQSFLSVLLNNMNNDKKTEQSNEFEETEYDDKT